MNLIENAAMSPVQMRENTNDLQFDIQEGCRGERSAVESSHGCCRALCDDDDSDCGDGNEPPEQPPIEPPSGGYTATGYFWYNSNSSANGFASSFQSFSPLANDVPSFSSAPAGSYPDDGSVMSHIMNNPSLASNWSHTFNGASNWVNIGAAYTGLGWGGMVTWAAAPTLATVPQATITLEARAYGTYLAWAGSTSGIVIGAYVDQESNYVEAAREEGLGALNAWMPAYRFFSSRGEWWTLNKAYIDEGVALGRQFFLYLPEEAKMGQYLKMEIERLSQLGISRGQLIPVY